MERLISAFKNRNDFVEKMAFDVGFEKWSKISRNVAWGSGLGRGLST